MDIAFFYGLKLVKIGEAGKNRAKKNRAFNPEYPVFYVLMKKTNA